MKHRKPTTYDSLSVPERILVLQDLWDELAADPSSIPVTPAQQRELDRRLKELEDSPNAGLSWAEVKRLARVRQ